MRQLVGRDDEAQRPPVHHHVEKGGRPAVPRPPARGRRQSADVVPRPPPLDLRGAGVHEDPPAALDAQLKWTGDSVLRVGVALEDQDPAEAHGVCISQILRTVMKQTRSRSGIFDIPVEASKYR